MVCGDERAQPAGDETDAVVRVLRATTGAGDSKAVLRDDAFDPSEPRLLPIREMGGNSAAQTDLHAVNSPESPSTPTDVTSLRPQYPPNLHNAASCLFLFPVRLRGTRLRSAGGEFPAIGC